MIQFLYGEDTFTLASEFAKLKGDFLQKHKDAAVEEINISEGMADQDLRIKLQEVLEAQGLFAKEKFVILRDLLGGIGQFPLSHEFLLRPPHPSGHPKNSRRILGATPTSPPHEGGSRRGGQEITIVFVQEDKFDKRSRLFKHLQKVAAAKEFALPRPDQLQTWMEGQLRELGFEIESAAAIELVSRLGEEFSLWQVHAELEKLILYAMTSPSSPPRAGARQGEVSGKITADMVRSTVTVSLNYNVFSLTNAMAEGRRQEALHILRAMAQEAGAQEKTLVIQVIGALASQIHSLLLVKNATGSAPEMAKLLDWKEGRVWINLKLAKKFTTEKLKKMLFDLKQIDLRVKTSDEPIELLLSLFIQRASPISL